MKRITLLHLITVTFLGLSANNHIFVKAQESTEEGKGSSLNLQSCSKHYTSLLHKPYVNGVTLREQTLSLKCCQLLNS